MKKSQIIGLMVLAIGIILPFLMVNEGTDFISGLLVGAGIGLILIGFTKRK